MASALRVSILLSVSRAGQFAHGGFLFRTSIAFSTHEMKSQAVIWVSVPRALHPWLSPQQWSLTENRSTPFRDHLAPHGRSCCCPPTSILPFFHSRIPHAFSELSTFLVGSLWVAGPVVYNCRTCSSIPGLHPRDASSTSLHRIQNVSRTATCLEGESAPGSESAPVYSAGALGRPTAAWLKIRSPSLLHSQ